MFEYNGMIHQGGPDYSRVIMKGFLNGFEHTEDAMFYLTKGLEMIHHELQSQYDNKKEDDYHELHKINKLRNCIDQLKGTA